MQQLLSKLDRKPGTHKGENGKVGIIGGSKEYTGAPSITAKAALRTGCDLTKILSSQKNREILASYSENFIIETYKGDYFTEDSLENAEHLANWSDVLVVGPGLGQKTQAVQELVSSIDTLTIIDADAIKPALKLDITEAVFTPHRKEAEYIEQEFGSIEEFVESERAIVVQKGSIDQIFTASQKFENKTGLPAMTTGGTGDALTGVIASLISQGLGPVDAARLGTWINGKAGEKAANDYGNGMLPTDLIQKIPDVMG